MLLFYLQKSLIVIFLMLLSSVLNLSVADGFAGLDDVTMEVIGPQEVPGDIIQNIQIPGLHHIGINDERKLHDHPGQGIAGETAVEDGLQAMPLPREDFPGHPGMIDDSGLLEPGLLEPDLLEPGLLEPGLIEPGVIDPGGFEPPPESMMPPEEIPIDIIEPPAGMSEPEPMINQR